MSWSLIVGLGVLKLFYPLWGDQALFLYYARDLDRGMRLYVDLWDIKQPGVFWFYLAAGKLFGFTAIGVHVLEWLWLACAALLLRWAAKAAFTQPWVAELVPLFTIGLYYWCAGAFWMTQVEILVATPLAGCLLVSILGLRHPERMPWLHVIFGLCTALVAIFKLIVVVVPISFWLVWVAHTLASRKQRVGTTRVLVAMLLPALFGAFVPLALVAVHFILAGSWNEFIWTSFVWPRLMLQEHEGKSIRSLYHAAHWLIAVSLPVLVLALTVLDDLKYRPLKLIETQTIVWLVVGMLVISVQRLSWWRYHFLLLVPAVGLLAASACERIATRPMARSTRVSGTKRAKWVAVVTLAAMFALNPGQTWLGLRATAQGAVAPSHAHLESFRDTIDPSARDWREGIAALRKRGKGRDNNNSTIYVFGDPNWALEFDRPQAVPVHGWTWELLLRRQWDAFPQQIRAAAPEYIYVHPFYAEQLDRTAPAVAAFIASDYQLELETREHGHWYRRRHAREGDPTSPQGRLRGPIDNRLPE